MGSLIFDLKGDRAENRGDPYVPCLKMIFRERKPAVWYLLPDVASWVHQLRGRVSLWTNRMLPRWTNPAVSDWTSPFQAMGPSWGHDGAIMGHEVSKDFLMVVCERADEATGHVNDMG